MLYRERIIKDLEICTTRPCYCTGCSYKKDCALDSQQLMEDALTLLREQESVEPIKIKKEIDFHSEIVDAFGCGNCGHELDHCEKWAYCPRCGRKIKWNK